jgi:tetratricopeptide (TPR) repeat protein
MADLLDHGGNGRNAGLGSTRSRFRSRQASDLRRRLGRSDQGAHECGACDDRNADIQNYLGYAYRRLRQFDLAMQHYQRALILNPRHRSAHEHLGEAHLARGDLAKAKEQLAALEQICLMPCDEYDDLKRAITEYNKVANR